MDFSYEEEKSWNFDAYCFATRKVWHWFFFKGAYEFGKWEKGPGIDLFNQLKKELGDMYGYL